MAGLPNEGDIVAYTFNGEPQAGTIVEVLPSFGIAVIERDSDTPSIDAVSVRNIERQHDLQSR